MTRRFLLIKSSLAVSAFLCTQSVMAQVERTPPIAPKIQETLLPPPVELPVPSTLPPDVPNRPLTAEEAVQIALHNQPSIVAARASLAAQQARTQQARAGLQTTLSVSGGYTHSQTLASEGGATFGGGGPSGGSGTGGGAPGYSASASIRRLLYDYNHTRDLIRQSLAQEQATAANLTRVQSDLVLQVKQAFYTYVQNTRLAEVNETNVRNQQDHLAVAQARLNAGLGLPSDVVRAQTAVAEAILNLNLARNNASLARVNLTLLMGIDSRTPVQAAQGGEPVIPTDNVDELVRLALKQRPEIIQAQRDVLAAEHGVSAAKTGNAPNLALNLGLSSRGESFPPGNDGLTVGAVVQWSPFDGGLARQRVKEAQANVEAVRAQLSSVQLSVTADVAQAYLNLRTAEQRVTTAEAEIANAEESVRLAEGRYRAGVGTFIEVTDAQAALQTARTNRVNAQSAVDQASAALAHAVGQPIATGR